MINNNAPTATDTERAIRTADILSLLRDDDHDARLARALQDNALRNAIRSIIAEGN